jgi:rare lipoprotein A
MIGVYAEQGLASWYGVPFHGRRAADGEIFDMNALVAAHRTLPFGSLVRVTNLNNGKQTEVRIIDRGPFVEGRVLDLAHAAAVALGMIGTGTAPVRIELLTAPGPLTGEFTVQIGAFADRSNADRLRDRLLPRYPTILIQEYDAPAGRLYRVRVGACPRRTRRSNWRSDCAMGMGSRPLLCAWTRPTTPPREEIEAAIPRLMNFYRCFPNPRPPYGRLLVLQNQPERNSSEAGVRGSRDFRI